MKQLRKDEIKQVNEVLRTLYARDMLTKKDKVVVKDEQLWINDKHAFFYYEEKPIPTIKLLLEDPLLKKVTVDMGAVRFMIKGADVMRPGIVAIEDDIAQGEAVMVIDQNNKKPLVVGIALMPSAEMQAASSGKVIRTIHYVGDAIWYAK